MATYEKAEVEGFDQPRISQKKEEELSRKNSVKLSEKEQLKTHAFGRENNIETLGRQGDS